MLVGDIVADGVADAVMDDEMLSENVALAVLDALAPIASVAAAVPLTERLRDAVLEGVKVGVEVPEGVDVAVDVTDCVLLLDLEELSEIEGVPLAEAPTLSGGVGEALTVLLKLSVVDGVFEGEGVAVGVNVGEVVDEPDGDGVSE